MCETLAKNLLFTMAYSPDFLLDYAKEAKPKSKETPRADLRISKVTVSAPLEKTGNPTDATKLWETQTHSQA